MEILITSILTNQGDTERRGIYLLKEFLLKDYTRGRGNYKRSYMYLIRAGFEKKIRGVA